MKSKGALMEYSKERINDLMRAYDEYLSSCGYIRMTDVYSTIVSMPSTRFWVSDTRASLVVSAISRGENVLDGMWETKREMYKEIYRRVMELGIVDPSLCISERCSLVVAQRAPKFYISPGSAKMMVCKARKEWTLKKMQRLRLL